MVVYSFKKPVVFADDEETVLLHYDRPSLTGSVTEERIFEFDRWEFLLTAMAQLCQVLTVLAS